MSRRCFSQSVALQRVEELTGKKAPFRECDLCDEAALEDVFRTVSSAAPFFCYFEILIEQ